MYAGFTNVNKSTDGGYNWTALSPLPFNGINNNETSALAVANSNSNVIYAARRIRFEFSSPPGMYRTSDGGSTWTEISSGLPDTLYYTSIDVSQTDANTAFVTLSGFVSGEKVYKTINGGAIWQNISYNLPNIPVNCIKTVPGSNKKMIATDLGVYMLDEAASLWVSQSAGLPNVIITDIEFNQTLDKIYISTFGRGIWETNLSAMVGINNNNPVEIGVELFPSLNNGTFTIQLSDAGLLNELLNLEIIDVKGRLVHKSSLTGKNSAQVNTNLPPGMYFARIKNRKLNGVKRFVVQ